MNKQQHNMLEKAHEKASQAVIALMRSTAPGRTAAPIVNDLDEAAHMLRIAAETVAELQRDVKRVGAES